ncbi:MAG: B12-binding domain-containing radical SAM protein [Desulfobacterales bacterium]|nr:B12-binding domain-containing radical SAM protein [Desulfobacterales bacterium]
MKITVLEHPRIRSEEHFNDIANTPLWSCLIGGYAVSALRQAGHEVDYMDTTVSGLDFKGTEDFITAQNPDLLCCNAVYFWEHTGWLFEMLDNLRHNGFEGHINLIGFFPTLAYQVILKHVSAVDSVIVGECENSLVKLAQRVEEDSGIYGIPGVAVLKNGTACMASPVKVSEDPDRFIFPDRIFGNDLSSASILASRGCYNHCAFCLIPSFYGRGPLWKGRSPENIVMEMKKLTEKGYSDFYFIDPNFIGPGKKGRERCEKLMDMIGPMNITFGMETRPDDLDHSIFGKLVKSGLTSLLLGVESGSKTILEGLNKGSKVSVSEEAIKICRDHGVEPEIGFLMFVPDASLADLEHNYEFLLRNNLLDRLDRTANLLAHRQIVMMGTPGFKMYEEQGRLKRYGILGFEGDVAYADERVKMVSNAVIFACLYVLKSMERPQSPIYWKKQGKDNGYEKISSDVNDYLVKVFAKFISMAKEDSNFFKSQQYRKMIITDMSKALGEGGQMP